MRIVSGYLKGRRFSPPSSFKARPTTDFAKENLFNILNNRINFEETKVLDLFSGTGSISFEFASRGCKDITSVELNFNHYKFIKKCAEDLELNSIVKCIKGDCFKYIEKCTKEYDIIFSDPPFDLTKADDLPILVLSTNILKKDGLFILEHSDKKSFSKHPNFIENRNYGKVNFSIFKHNE
ncbi:MAG: RsmD family RNA methyltransferase [Marinilabiliaceae bacterium]|nr:RsmD family RNA methyltransferase [Marinilabiliaceae bacterium]